jgi:predicted permease
MCGVDLTSSGGCSSVRALLHALFSFHQTSYIMGACNLVESLLQLVLHVFYLILGHVSLVIYSVTHGSEEPAGEAGGRRGTRTLAH